MAIFSWVLIVQILTIHQTVGNYLRIMQNFANLSYHAWKPRFELRSAGHFLWYTPYLSLAWCDSKVTRIIKIVRFVDTGILSSSIKSNYTYAHSNMRRFRAFDWTVHNFLEPLHWPVYKQPVVMPKSFVTRIQIPQCVQSLKNRQR